jgi:hypothetical protein
LGLTTEQQTTLHKLLFTKSLVMDRVYYQYKTHSVNFRCAIDPLAEPSKVRALNAATESVRFAIMDDGTIVDRNSDRRFTQS